MKMKKSFIIALLVSSILPATVFAQYYNQGYYGGAPYYGTGYVQPAYNQGYYPQQAAYQAQPQAKPTARPQQQGRTISPFSMGGDYVFGYASFKDTAFDVPSALTDGDNYSSTARSFDRKHHSVGFNLGFRPLKNIGVEAFYQRSLPQNKVSYTESYSYYPEFARGEYDVNYKVYGVDLLGFLPINDYIELIASIGVGKYDVVAKVKVVAYEDTTYTKLKESSLKMEDSKMAYRIGAGFQFWVSKHLAFRVMGRWTQIGGDVMNYITEVNSGIRYHF